MARSQSAPLWPTKARFEVGSATPFVHERRAALPANVAFYVCEGGADEIHVDAAADHWFECRIAGRLVEAVEPPVLRIRNGRCDFKSGRLVARPFGSAPAGEPFVILRV